MSRVLEQAADPAALPASLEDVKIQKKMSRSSPWRSGRGWCHSTWSGCSVASTVLRNSLIWCTRPRTASGIQWSGFFRASWKIITVTKRKVNGSKGFESGRQRPRAGFQGGSPRKRTGACKTGVSLSELGPVSCSAVRGERLRASGTFT